MYRIKKEENTIIYEYLDYHKKYEAKYGKDRTLVLEQVGSFYECYATINEGPNLQQISQILNIVLTRKNKNINEISKKNPYMIGFPTIASVKHINTLIENNYTVIVVDQDKNEKNTTRTMSNIISPGTCLDLHVKQDNNYVISLLIEEELQKNKKYIMGIGMSAFDLGTGKIFINEALSIENDEKYALDEASRFINSISPKEIIIIFKKKQCGMTKEQIISYLELNDKLVHYKEEIDKKYYKINYQAEYLSKIYNTGIVSPHEYLNLETYMYCHVSLVYLLDFAYDHNNKSLKDIPIPEIYFDNKNLVLGNNAVRQLNLIEPEINSGPSKFKSLYDIVNNASTAMGRRLIRERLISPLISHEELNKIYDNIEEIQKTYKDYESKLNTIIDIERMNRKMGLSLLHPYELHDIYLTYESILSILEINKKNKKLHNLMPSKEHIKNIKLLIEEIKNNFKLDELKKYQRNDISGFIFNKNIHKEIDILEDYLDSGHSFMNKLSEILSKIIQDNKEIKINKNDLDGYYLSLSKKKAKLLKEKLEKEKTIKVDDHEISVNKFEFSEKKSSTKIIFTELKNKSKEVDKYKDDLIKLNSKYFQDFVINIYNKYKDSMTIMKNYIATIDYLKSNAKTAELYNYSRPKLIFNDKYSYIKCTNLRHPIIERIIDYEYVPYDIELGTDKLKGILAYGLNGSGKTAIMKAIGLCVIMAQSGMFVPAEECEMSPYRQFYTRISGNDNLFKGLSSYAVEMVELNAIIKRANAFTLVIGDEICRGTEHISGNAIVASSILKLSKMKASFIFATHLHELVNMQRIKELNNVKAFHLSVSYDAVTDTLIYDRKLKEGSGEPIYGITVAKYIIQDKDFIEDAISIKNELLDQHNSMISGKTSKYNSQVFIYECQICHTKDTTGFIGPLQTHHINFQKDCEKGFVKNKKHIKKNDKANLIVLCEECHNKLHNEDLEISGYVMTSKGKKVITNKK
jgi:DNA mismatch repair protein MutS